MIGIHPVHRRLAELTVINQKRSLTIHEQVELFQCLKVNAPIVQRLDELKQLAYVAQVAGDMAWVQEICGQIDAIEAKMI